MNKESYKTISKETVFEIDKIKSSKFIGRLFPVKTVEEAEAKLAIIKKQFYDANHNCFAYCTGLGEKQITRFSDDGEPSSTAGKPIFSVLKNSDLTDILCVVTRYFGGTKLGTGGLIKAYTESAKAVFEVAEPIVIELKEELSFSYIYDLTNFVMNILNKFEAKIISEEYGNEAKITISINRGFTSSFKSEIYDSSNGKIEVEEE